MNISQTTSAQHIPPRKANRSFPIPFASCAIFWNATILLSPSIAKEILKSQRSNAPSVASCGWSPFIKLANGGRIPLNTAMKNVARWRPDRRQHGGDWEQGNESRCRAQTKRKCQ
jgi:hypothetical protein